MSEDAALQDRYAPNGACFGCGPRNEKGLRVKSHVRGDEVVATWRAEKFHEAYDGILSGGIIGTLMDCHSNWTAGYHLMKQASADAPPSCVTAEYSVKLRRPTPTHGDIDIVARIVAGRKSEVSSGMRVLVWTTTPVSPPRSSALLPTAAHQDDACNDQGHDGSSWSGPLSH